MKVKPLSRSEAAALTRRDLPELLAGKAELDSIPQTRVKSWNLVGPLLAWGGIAHDYHRLQQRLMTAEAGGDEPDLDTVRENRPGVHLSLTVLEHYLGVSGSVEGFKLEKATQAYSRIPWQGDESGDSEPVRKRERGRQERAQQPEASNNGGGY